MRKLVVRRAAAVDPIAEADLASLGIHRVDPRLRRPRGVRAGRAVGAQRLLVTRSRAGHAQPRIGIDIAAADKAFHQLIGGVVILGENLPGNINGNRIRAVFIDHPLELTGDFVQRRIPACPLSGDLWIQQPIFKTDRVTQCRTFGTQPAKIGRMRRISGNGYRTVGLRRRQNATADTTIRTSCAGGSQTKFLYR